MSIKPPTQTALQNLPQTIGMNPEQDANSKHGTFQITESTKEAGAGMRKRKSPYLPNPARTLVMEQLPKTHRTIGFVDGWCRSACGVPPLHVFVDSASAKALIEFATSELARKAWSSPRLGQDLLKLKSHQLRGKAREDLVKVWWYRVDGVGAGGGVGEIEEGEIEEDSVGEKELRPPPPPAPEAPRKETKKERKLRLAKQRERKKGREMQLKMNSQQSEQKQEVIEVSPTTSLNPPLPLSVPSQAASPQMPALLPITTTYSFDPILTSVYTSTSSQCPISQSTPQLQQQQYSGPPSMPKTAVGTSLPRGGHDDSESTASSDGRSTPLPDFKPAASSSKAVIASTEGQADDLADSDKANMDVDVSGERSVNRTDAPSVPSSFALPARPQTPLPVHHPLPAPPDLDDGNSLGQKRVQHSQAQSTYRHPAAFAPTRTLGQPHLNRTQPRNYQTATNLKPAIEGPAVIALSDAIDGTSRAPPTSPKPFASMPNGASENITSGCSGTKPLPLSHDATKQSSAVVRSKLEERIAKSKMELATAGALLAQNGVNHVPQSRVAVAVNTPSEVSGQVMEENLRQLVFASKNKIRPVAQSNSARPDMTPKPRTTPASLAASEIVPQDELDSQMHVRSNDTDSSSSRESCPDISIAASPSAPKLSLMSDTPSNSFSFEDMAVSFITQTIETIKAAPRPTSDHQSGESSVSSAATSVLATPSPPTPAMTPAFGLSAISTNLVKPSLSTPLPTPPISSSIHVKSGLAIKQRRLEEHIQETKSLMVRISMAKTKHEKDLLFKIMREKTRCVRLGFLCKLYISPPSSALMGVCVDAELSSSPYWLPFMSLFIFIRLFEEEQKVDEKRLAKATATASNPRDNNKSQITSSMTLQLQQWPTAQYDSILLLSDDED